MAAGTSSYRSTSPTSPTDLTHKGYARDTSGFSALLSGVNPSGMPTFMGRCERGGATARNMRTAAVQTTAERGARLMSLFPTQHSATQTFVTGGMVDMAAGAASLAELNALRAQCAQLGDDVEFLKESLRQAEQRALSERRLLGDHNEAIIRQATMQIDNMEFMHQQLRGMQANMHSLRRGAEMQDELHCREREEWEERLGVLEKAVRQYREEEAKYMGEEIVHVNSNLKDALASLRKQSNATLALVSAVGRPEGDRDIEKYLLKRLEAAEKEITRMSLLLDVLRGEDEEARSAASWCPGPHKHPQYTSLCEAAEGLHGEQAHFARRVIEMLEVPDFEVIDHAQVFFSKRTEPDWGMVLKLDQEQMSALGDRIKEWVDHLQDPRKHMKSVTQVKSTANPRSRLQALFGVVAEKVRTTKAEGLVSRVREVHEDKTFGTFVLKQMRKLKAQERQATEVDESIAEDSSAPTEAQEVSGVSVQGKELSGTLSVVASRSSRQRGSLASDSGASDSELLGVEEVTGGVPSTATLQHSLEALRKSVEVYRTASNASLASIENLKRELTAGKMDGMCGKGSSRYIQLVEQTSMTAQLRGQIVARDELLRGALDMLLQTGDSEDMRAFVDQIKRTVGETSSTQQGVMQDVVAKQSTSTVSVATMDECTLNSDDVEDLRHIIMMKNDELAQVNQELLDALKETRALQSLVQSLAKGRPVEGSHTEGTAEISIDMGDTAQSTWKHPSVGKEPPEPPDKGGSEVRATSQLLAESEAAGTHSCEAQCEGSTQGRRGERKVYPPSAPGFDQGHEVTVDLTSFAPEFWGEAARLKQRARALRLGQRGDDHGGRDLPQRAAGERQPPSDTTWFSRTGRGVWSDRRAHSSSSGLPLMRPHSAGTARTPFPVSFATVLTTALEASHESLRPKGTRLRGPTKPTRA